MLTANPYVGRLLNAAMINQERAASREDQPYDSKRIADAFERTSRYDDIDLRRGSLSSSVMLNRGIKRAADTAQFLTGEVGDWFTALESDPRKPATEARPATPRLDDIRNDVLYQLWGQQVFDANGIMTYARFCLYVAKWAVVRLLAQHPGGTDLLTSIMPDVALQPNRQDCLAFLEEYFLLPTDPGEAPAWSAADAFIRKYEPVTGTPNEWDDRLSAIPNIIHGAEALLIAYGNTLRLERDRCTIIGDRCMDSPLPDDPSDDEDAPVIRQRTDDEIRSFIMAQAAEVYLESGKNFREIADEYNLPHHRFRQYLKDQGIVRPRGRQRKG